MKKYLLISMSVLFFATGQTQAQTTDFVFTITNASSDTTCNGQISIQFANSLELLTYNWAYMGNIIGTGTTISGLCPGNYTLDIYSNCQNYSFDVFLSTYFLSGPSFEMSVTINHSNGSALSSFEIQEVLGGITPYYTQFWSNNDSLYADTTNTISNLFFDSLSNSSNNDFHSFYVADSSYFDFNGYYDFNYIFFSFNTFYDSTYCYSNGNTLFASAQGTPVSDSTTCDGTAYVEAYGGTPPYSYQFSSGSTNSTETGLCPGSYIVTITDANSNVFSSTFVIGYPGTYYFFDGGNYNYLDTLYSNAMQDCGIDYSMPIDSFYIDSSYALSNWEYVVNWTIIQDSNQFLFTETYFIDSTGYYWFGLSLYCDTRSSDFGSYTFFAGAMADMSGAPTGIKDVNADDLVSVYPNPSNGVYTISSASKITSYSVFDSLGREILRKSKVSTSEQIDIQQFNNGMYYLVVQFKDGATGRQKLLKK